MSGLKINLHKSKLIGIGVTPSQVADVARSMGCGFDSILFVNLGVRAGHNMNQVNTWSSIIDKFCSRLAGWKAKCLSFGGGLTLIKLVLGSVGN